MQVIELIIDEKDSQSGIDAVSVVESPAIEENFIALSKHEVELKEVNTEKRILMGAALIPNKKIYRVNQKKRSITSTSLRTPCVRLWSYSSKTETNLTLPTNTKTQSKE
jgi:hypothetical protein